MTNNTYANQASRCATCTHSAFCAALFRAPSASAGGASQQFLGANAGRQIIAQGHETDDVLVLCVGWAFRYLQLPDGSRQILKFLLPGDILSPALVYESVPESSVQALTAVQAAAFKRSDVQARCADKDLSQAIARSLVEDGHHAELLVAVVAHLSAEERVAHLFLHLMRRIAAMSVIREERYPFPLRQQHIADAVGLTTVHVSRIVSGFRERQILSVADGVLQVFNRAALDRIGSLS